jgi:hypothetical protein
VEEVTLAAHLRALALASCLSLLSASAGACTFASVLIKGSSSFKVTVLDYRERPMEGASIVLSRGEKEEKRFITDSNGEALIGELPAGLYELNLDQDIVKFFAQAYGLEVTKDSKGQRDLVFHWPSQNVIATSMLSGTLHYWKTAPAANNFESILKRSRNEGTSFPLAKAQLSLFKFGSKEMIEETTTDNEGRFAFRVAVPGLYYMRFKFESYEEIVLIDFDRYFGRSAPFLDVLINDVIICGDAPGYQSLNSPT